MVRAQDGIEAMLSAMGRGPKTALVMARYNVYLDGSGTDRGQSAVAFAGVIGRSERWQKFSKEWARELNRAGVPYLHMAEFVAAKGIFYRWSIERRGKLIHPLVHVLATAAKAVVGCGVRVADYDAALSDALKQHVGGPEIVCFAQCLLRALAIVPATDRVSVFVDQDSGRRQARLLNAYNRIRESAPGVKKRLAGIVFADKREQLPLQAADLLAHQAFQHLRDDLPSKNMIREVFRAVLLHVKHDFRTYEFPDLLRASGATAEDIEIKVWP